MNNDAHREAQKLVDLAHPLGIALGQVVVDRDHMDAMAGQGIQIAGEGGNQGFAFAGLHFADLALVQNHAANQLHVKVAHLHGTPARLAHHRESLRQDFVERLLFGGLALIGVLDSLQTGSNPLAELNGLCPQLLIGKHLGIRFQRADHRNDRHQPLDQAFVRCTENLGQDLIEKHRNLRLPV